MKKIKPGRTALSFIMITAIFLAMLMMIMDMCVAGESWFMHVEDGVIQMDWHYAGVYFTAMAVALICWLIRYIAYSLPAYREDPCKLSILLEWIIFVGLVLAIVGLFLPAGIEASATEAEETYDNIRMMANVTLSWIGLPLAFMASIFKSTLVVKAK